MPSTLGRLLLLLGAPLFGYSAWAVHQERVRLAQDKYFPSPLLIGYLASSVYLLLLGVLLTAPPLKHVTWRAEMRTRSIDQVDARIGFADVRGRAHLLFGDAALVNAPSASPPATGR